MRRATPADETVSTNLTYPGAYRINSIILYPAPNSENRAAIEIRSIVPGLTIVESMTNDSIRGTIRVVDASGVLEAYPIRGEEEIFLQVEDSLGYKREYRFFVYRVDNIEVSDSNDSVSYILHFVSFQRFYSEQKRVTSSHNTQISKIAENVFNTYYRRPVSRTTDYNKQIQIEPTEGLLKLVIPRMTPAQAMKFLESRAFSSASPTCSFRFFESADSFYFASDEYMYTKALNEDRIFFFTFADNIPRDGTRFLQAMENFTTFKNTIRVDTFDDLNSGTYKCKIVVLDIINRTVNTIDPAFSYTDVRDLYFSASDPVVDRHSDTFIEKTFTDENARRFMMVRDYTDENVGQLRGDQFFPEITANRLMYFKNLDSIRVSSSGPGRLDVTCGDFADVAVPEFRFADPDKELNYQLSGEYMIESITRVFDKDVYTNNYSLCKRGWSQEITNPETNVFSNALVGSYGENIG